MEGIVENPEDRIRAIAQMWIGRANRAKEPSHRKVALDMARTLEDSAQLYEQSRLLLTDFSEALRMARASVDD